jgi:hypothetical protein
MAQQVKISQPTSTPTPTIQQGSSSSWSFFGKKS